MLVSLPTGTTLRAAHRRRRCAHRHRHSARRLRAEIIDAQRDVGLLADDGEARGADDGELAVALVVLPDDQRLERRVHGELVGRRRVMHFAVGDDDGARDALRRHIGKRAVECGEQLRAVVLAVVRVSTMASRISRFLSARKLFA